MTGCHLPVAMKDEWLTPRHVLNALGHFDLDPCAPVVRPWPTAKQHFSIEDNGLLQPWHGRVWLNPPYGRAAVAWLDRLVLHGRGTALIFARTETEMFFRDVFEVASTLLFLRGRLHFHHVSGERAAGNSGAPSCLVAYGDKDAAILAACGLPGYCVWLR